MRHAVLPVAAVISSVGIDVMRSLMTRTSRADIASVATTGNVGL